jgi:hypothetical protein
LRVMAQPLHPWMILPSHAWLDQGNHAASARVHVCSCMTCIRQVLVMVMREGGGMACQAVAELIW